MSKKNASGIVEPQPLLKLLGTVTVPATTERFVVSDKFQVGKLFKDAMISSVGDNFRQWFNGKIEGPRGATELCRHELICSSVDGLIIAELGEDKVETTLSAIYALMEGQGKCRSGPLLANGYANIFYIHDVSTARCTVCVSLTSDGWEVRAFSVRSPIGWYGGSRVFSRALGRLGLLVLCPL